MFEIGVVLDTSCYLYTHITT